MNKSKINLYRTCTKDSHIIDVYDAWAHYEVYIDNMIYTHASTLAGAMKVSKQLCTAL